MGRDSEPRLCEANVRALWGRMVGEILPAAAPRFGWPPLTPAEYAEALLDQVRQSPCEPGRPPCAIDLVLAIELADRALRGQVCMKGLARRSREMRERAGRGRG
ncbi:hypothetical protein [Amaricoccus solimangrovi]|uniref:Uncharacterized protein n=1 Tax=Amaricoccus solimangrovi TaxID=2589815 RepID=A0A501WPN7_9RHOB|nr:hypothetical protein [Amaricoccus solimangrovi]TPE51419.1 hypothetical protein FJM51_09260 [Amaricoccus solimangrovi]